MIFTATFLTSCLKLLLIPAYRSTDFEVHRNWMAITYSLPLKQWYCENTSEWTLDYPPLFAYFEYLLSLIASLFDKNMLIVQNLNYASDETILFQRLSVILTDLVFSYGTHKCCSSIQKSWKTDVVLPILLITNCGLIMVDHIHFQYNGILYGILLLSISYAIQGRYLLSGFWYTVLLNMKHIYIYLAPAYFVFFLKNYCLNQKLSKFQIKHFIMLGSTVLAVFFATFLPFYDQLGQVFTRMFPFKRGLCHAYWAPNFWALYNTIDKAAFLLMSKMGFLAKKSSVASMTGGLVQEFSHEVLPNVTPLVTMILTGAMMLPALIKLWTLNKHPSNFLRCIVLCALSSFLFGWHVHEKAILMAIIPLSILSIMDLSDAKTFILLGIVGHYSLFPLLFPSSLLVIKVLLLLLYSIYTFHSLSKVYPFAIYNYSFPLLNCFESIYILGLSVIFVYENFLHQFLGLGTKLPYLPLLLTSLYCSVGIIYSWIGFYINFFTRTNVTQTKPNKKFQ
ncbi:probable dolichyl pyrophosphate Glc1Man9GlcNAc2 alpha-1,3-glucosyltransferase [Tribolium madens]|uniref:probable dolichyl pyrophosphate Glc1Man9GlcNAc2 alpha-1,3-glucosyltransferase n=1 Tax=Tribolium madens TaxID=41895 RepID=UPI001CF73E70|nr:probable dolichyl pyrophosphate Glc1Man9GlcNAc2 alpha-1,3-glucosyltransferase [Tribolium madens]